MEQLKRSVGTQTAGIPAYKKVRQNLFALVVNKTHWLITVNPYLQKKIHMNSDARMLGLALGIMGFEVERSGASRNK